MACANPVAVADLHPGDRVLDLGCGGFLGVLLSARRVGPGGHVVGVDASPDVIELARGNRVLGTHTVATTACGLASRSDSEATVWISTFRTRKQALGR
jgi:tRNA A58 N-methylase Trm61